MHRYNIVCNLKTLHFLIKNLVRARKIILLMSVKVCTIRETRKKYLQYTILFNRCVHAFFFIIFTKLNNAQEIVLL
jgi:hypothetical protein